MTLKSKTRPRDARHWFQAFFAVALNAWVPGWFKPGIFQGGVKGVCVPVLNCYSCPSALGACPIGSMQTFFGELRSNLSLGVRRFGLYVIGFLGLAGSLVGRMTCGWVCPFGSLQELLYKVPGPKIRLPRFLSWFRYAFLVVMVILLPLLVLDSFGAGETWFCKWVCPAGTLEAGIPLLLLDKGLRPMIGFMFHWKVGLLVVFVVLMVLSRRPFCRAVCPLGAFLGPFNKVSVFRMSVDLEKCTRCDQCYRECPVDLKFYEGANSPDCVRCLKCVSSCKFGAISWDFAGRREVSEDVRARTSGNAAG